MRVALAVVVLAVSAFVPKASAQLSTVARWWPLEMFPCAGGIGSVASRSIIACHAELTEQTGITGGPNDAVAHVGDVWIGVIDEASDATGLAAFRLAADGINWTRGIHVPTRTVIGTAVSGNGARLATVELRSHGARSEVVLVERALPSLTHLRDYRLAGSGEVQSADVRYLPTGIAVAIAGRVVVVGAHEPHRSLLDVPRGVGGLSPDGTTAVVVAPVAGDALAIHVVDLTTGVEQPSFEIPGGGPTAVAVADGALRIAILDDHGVRVVQRPRNEIATLARREDAMSALAFLERSLYVWSAPTADSGPLLSAWREGRSPAAEAAREEQISRGELRVTEARADGTRRFPAPGVEVSTLGAFAVRTTGRAETPLRSVDPAGRPIFPIAMTRLISGATADDPPAELRIDLFPAFSFSSTEDPNAWARAVAATLGPVHVEATHVVGDHVVEIDGWDDGCDPPAAWVRVERRGDWLVRTELSVYGGDDAARARADGWKEALRHAVR